ANVTALATIPLPDLCADVRAWAASGFSTIPQRIVELDRRVESLELPEIQWRLVAPYVRGGDKGLIASIKRAERKIAETEFMRGRAEGYRVPQTRGLPP